MKSIMKSKLTNFLLIAVAALGLSSVLAPAAHAEDYNFCSDTNVSTEVRLAAGCDASEIGGEAGALPEAKDVISNVVLGIIGFLGVVAVVVILIGGIQYITAAGDAGKVKTAKNTILYAVIGLAICALAFAIVNFATEIINSSQPE